LPFDGEAKVSSKKEICIKQLQIKFCSAIENKLERVCVTIVPIRSFFLMEGKRLYRLVRFAAMQGKFF